MATNFYPVIKRSGPDAVIEIFEIVYTDGTPATGKMVACYETSSVGAAKSARKAIAELKAKGG